MSDLSYLEKNQLEKLFQMGGGYVLDFSNRTFQEFIADSVRREIEDQKYDYASGSKANRLRQFWKVESNPIVGMLTKAMVEYAGTLQGVDDSLIPIGRKIAARLLDSPNELCSGLSFDTLSCGEGVLESEMTERILKSSISTLEAFNHVRNNQSFAHDNTLLNYEESLLIYNHVCASIRFLQSIETRLHDAAADAERASDADEIPF